MSDKTTRGYASVENWIIRQCEGLTEHELVVFLVLRSYAGNKPFCSPSRETIAANARVSVRTADKALRGLAAKGFITWRQQSEAGRKKSSAYTIRVDLKDCINGTLGPGLDVQELHIRGAGAAHQNHLDVQIEQIRCAGAAHKENHINKINNINVCTPDGAADPSKNERADVDKVCNALAARIEANGAKRPTISKRWKDEARRLIDLDGHPVPEILEVIAWCQASIFWRSNILSLPTLRKQYDRLKMQMRDRAATGGRVEQMQAFWQQGQQLDAETHADPKAIGW